MTQKRKYEFTSAHMTVRARRVRQIRHIKTGIVGGYLESEHNLSHLGTCWVDHNAVVLDSAQVRGHARVTNNAVISGRAVVTGAAEIANYACVRDDAVVSGRAYVGDCCRIAAKSKIGGTAALYGNVYVGGAAEVSGDALLRGYIRVTSQSRICDKAAVITTAGLAERGHRYGTDHRTDNYEVKILGQIHVYANMFLSDGVYCWQDDILYVSRDPVSLTLTPDGAGVTWATELSGARYQWRPRVDGRYRRTQFFRDSTTRDLWAALMPDIQTTESYRKSIEQQIERMLTQAEPLMPGEPINDTQQTHQPAQRRIELPASE